MKNSIFHNAMRRRRFLAIQLAIQCLLLFPLSVASTYTWFFLSKTPFVGNLQIAVQSTDGLLLAWEQTPKQWQEHLSYADVAPEKNVSLQPATYSYREDSFYAVTYTQEGRKQFTQKIDEAYDSAQSYLLKFTFFGHTDTDIQVELKDSQNGAGTFLREKLGWDKDNLSNYSIDAGARYAMRVGLRISPLDEEGNETISEKKTVIYEPNSDKHVDGADGYRPTTSIDDDSQTLIPEEYLYAQSVTTWQEKIPTKEGEVDYSYGEFLRENKALFSLTAGSTVKIEVVIWLEGQDEDCCNAIAATESQLFAQLAFRATGKHDSGYVE